MKLGSLITRLTLIYVGAALALLLILAISRVLSDGEAFRQDVNSSLRPALAGVVREMQQQSAAGRSLKDAATLTSIHLRRPKLRLQVLDNDLDEVFDSYNPRRANALQERIAWIAMGFFQLQGASASVRGGHVYVWWDVQRFVDAIGSDFLRIVPAVVLAAIVTYVFARLIDAEVRPLREVTRGLRHLAEGDFIPKTIVASGSPEFTALHTAYRAAATNLQNIVSAGDVSADLVQRFISNAGHELKTSLTIIVEDVDAVSKGVLTEPRDVQRSLRKALSECRRMASTTEKLLLLARPGGEDSHVCVIDVASLARQIAESMKTIVPGLQIEVFSKGTKPLTIGDERDLREAMGNIIDNAIKFAPGSPIDVRVTTTGEVVIVEIVDTGPGMSADDRERAFDGSGLGLTIAKRAVRRANGRITLTSELGSGTSVRLYLPCVTSDGGYEYTQEADELSCWHH